MTKDEILGTNSSVALLIICIALGGILFFHGFHKIGHGIEEQSQMLASAGIARFFMYFGYIKQALAPILIVIGVLTRMLSLKIFITMVVIFIVLPMKEETSRRTRSVYS